MMIYVLLKDNLHKFEHTEFHQSKAHIKLKLNHG